jgi:tetratricopeptide (TPR) repeat protein
MDREWRDIQRGLEDFPHSLAVHDIAMHAQLPRWGGSYAEMEKIADKGVAANPGDPRFVGLYSDIYADQADLYDRQWAAEKTIAMYSRALSYQQDPDWLAARGFLYHDEHELAKARADAEAGLRLDPTHVECLLLKADTVYHQGDAQTSMSLLAEAEKLYPGSESVAQIRDHLSRSR